MSQLVTVKVTQKRSLQIGLADIFHCIVDGGSGRLNVHFGTGVGHRTPLHEATRLALLNFWGEQLIDLQF